MSIQFLPKVSKVATYDKATVRLSHTGSMSINPLLANIMGLTEGSYIAFAHDSTTNDYFIYKTTDATNGYLLRSHHGGDKWYKVSASHYIKQIISAWRLDAVDAKSYTREVSLDRIEHDGIGLYRIIKPKLVL